MVKKGDILIAPEGCEDNLTAGKEYEVLKVYTHTFKILSDLKSESICKIKNCPNLEGQDWIIKPSYSKQQAEQVIKDYNEFTIGCYILYNSDKKFINHKFSEENKEVKEQIQQLENELEKLKSKL